MEMQIKRFALALTVFLAACSSGHVETYYVDHYQEACWGPFPRLCMRTSPDKASWTFDYDAIEGFTPTWGVVSRVKVRVDPVPNPPADASSVRVTLIETLSSEPVPAGTRFRLHRLDPNFVEVDAAGNHTLEHVPFSCATPAVCTEIDSRLAGGGAFDVEFSHGTPIRAEAVF
jgi:hypothetical protein